MKESSDKKSKFGVLTQVTLCIAIILIFVSTIYISALYFDIEMIEVIDSIDPEEAAKSRSSKGIKD